MEQREIKKGTARLKALMADRFGLSDGSLQVRAQKAGRRLPRRIRHDLRLVDQAQAAAGNPRLERQVDVRSLTAAMERAEAHLQAIDCKEQRKTRALGMLGSVMGNLLLVFALLIVVLIWRDLL